MFTKQAYREKRLNYKLKCGLRSIHFMSSSLSLIFTNIDKIMHSGNGKASKSSIGSKKGNKIGDLEGG